MFVLCFRLRLLPVFEIIESVVYPCPVLRTRIGMLT